MSVKRPVTAFFLFLTRLKEQGKVLSGAAAGALWTTLSQDEKQLYIVQYRSERKLYDHYLEEVVGVHAHNPGRTKQGQGGYEIHKIRAVWGSKKELKPISNNIPRALCRVLVHPRFDMVGRIHARFRTRTQRTAAIREQESRHANSRHGHTLL